MLAVSDAAAQNHSDLASYSCSSFLGDLDEGFPANRSKAIAMAAWATGYATAFQKKARADDTAIISIIDVLVNVCRQNSERTVIDAAALALKRAKPFPSVAARAPIPAERTPELAAAVPLPPQIPAPALQLPPQSAQAVPLPVPSPFASRQSLAKSDAPASMGGASPLSDDATGSFAATEPQAGFKTFANHDIFGRDYRKIAHASENVCVRTCEQDDKCQAYSYDKWTRSCYLKASVGAINLEPSSNLGIRAGVATPPMSDTASRIDPVNSKKIAGTVFSERPAASKAGCEATCRDDRKCVGFSFAQRTKACALFATIEAFLRDTDATSGVKTQNPRH
jgi:hypothetical protein